MSLWHKALVNTLLLEIDAVCLYTNALKQESGRRNRGERGKAIAWLRADFVLTSFCRRSDFVCSHGVVGPDFVLTSCVVAV